MHPFRHELDRVSSRPRHPSTLELPLEDRLYQHGACEGSTGLGLAVGVPFSRTPVTLSGIFGTNLKAVWPFYGSSLVTHSYSSDDEKVTDGGFDNAPDWTDSGSGHWAVAGSKATATTAAAGEYLKATVDPLVVGVLYQVTYTIDAISAGSITVYLGTTAGTARSAPGTYVENIRCAGSGQFAFYGSAGPTTGSITVCSVVGVSEQLYNGDFETGSPPTGWTSVSDATLTAQAGARTGGTGTQYLRLAIVATDSWGYATQTALVVGATYRARGWYRGDGGNGRPRFGTQTTPALSVGTTSNTWQYFDVTFRADHATVFLTVHDVTAGGAYAEFDDLSIVELPTVVTAPNSINAGTYDATNATKATQPALHPDGWNGTECIYTLGDSWLAADGLAALYTGADQPWAHLVVGQLDSTSQDGRFFHMGSSLAATPKDRLMESATGKWAEYRRDDAASAAAANDDASDTNKHVLAAMHTGTAVTIWTDGVVTSINGAASNVGVLTLDQFTLFAERDVGISAYIAGSFRIAAAITTTTANQMITASNLLDATEHV